MKNYLTFLAFIFLACSSQSQNVDWAITGGGLHNDRIVSFVTDHSSATYMLIRVDSGIVLDSRIEKHDASGNLNWTISIDPGIWVYKLLLTDQNDLCLVAAADSNINFAGTNLSPGMFCARLDLNGNWTNIKNANLLPPYYDMFGDFSYNDFSLDSLGRLYATGTKTMHPLQDEAHLLKSWHTGYFEMLDSSLTTLTYTAEPANKTYGFLTDALGNGGAIFSMTQFLNDTFTFKLFQVDEYFDTMWIANPTPGTTGGLQNVLLDENDQLYIEGFFPDTFSLNGFTFIDTANTIHAYIARLDGNGQVGWSMEMSSAYIWSGSVKISRILNNRIYLSIIFADSLKIAGNSLIIPDTNWVFLCLDLNGNVIWDYYQEYSYYYHQGFAAAVDDNENIYMYGVFQNNFSFNNNPSNGMEDWYIMRMPNTNVGVQEFTINSGEINIVPNPSSGLATLFISETVSQESSVSVCDIFGNQVFGFKTVARKNELDFGNCAPGLYFINVKGGNFSGSIKFNKVR